MSLVFVWVVFSGSRQCRFFILAATGTPTWAFEYSVRSADVIVLFSGVPFPLCAVYSLGCDNMMKVDRDNK